MFKYRINSLLTKNLQKNNLLSFNKFYFAESTTATTSYNSIKVSTQFENVGLIQLYRPKAKNALNSELIKELNQALNEFDNNEKIGCIVIGGDKDYFAAGADIKEMKDRSFPEVYETKMLDDWNKITQIR
jgi:enoyl-CoA hydratase/carnithine racemase